MSMELVLIISAYCTALGVTLSLLQIHYEDTPEPILEMDYDPEDICIVCGEACDDYEHWTRGG